MPRELTDELRKEILDAAIEVADCFQHAEDPDDPRTDKSYCAYNRRGLPGADPSGICSFGCQTEPSCMTDGPWPMDRLVIALAKAGLLEEPGR